MKPLTIALMLLLAVTCVAGEKLDVLKTTDGVSYSNVRLQRVERGRAVLFHSSGIVKLPLEQIPDDAREALGLPTRADLGQAKRERQEFEAEQRKKGLVAYGNEWITPAEKASREANDKAKRISASKFERNVAYKVLQALDDGLLCVRAEFSRYLGVTYTGDIFFLYGIGNRVIADGEEYRDDLYWTGTYSYTTVQGIPKTVNSYSVSRELALEIVKIKFGLVETGPPAQDEESAAVVAGGRPRPTAFGTGFVITKEGHILTNFHVVDGGDKLVVKTKTQTFEAELIAKDEDNDLAVIQVNARLAPVNFSPASNPKLGATVFTVGYPMPSLQGVEPKVTKGVVSSLRGLKDDIRMLQIDAAVQPGNSGGPLSDGTGSVVGVINARLNDLGVLLETGSLPQNVNYAIKNTYVKAFLASIPALTDKLLTGGNEERPFEDAVEAVARSTVLIEVY